jgi:hypothetical protein
MLYKHKKIFKRKPGMNTAIALSLLLTASGLSFYGCSNHLTIDVPPNLPAGYYGCIETTAEELVKAYSANYGDYNRAQAMYTGQPFVFKNIRVVKEMLIDENTFVTGSVQFNALEQGEVGKLKPGDVIDIVGINLGMPNGYPSMVYFNGCFFLPSGSVELPAPGGPAFTPMY